jgi:hypothetical protein
MIIKNLTVAFIIFTLFALSGCFPGSHHFADDSPAGFFSGVWHGWIAPISLIAGFFNDNIRVYEPHNTGWWYDLGHLWIRGDIALPENEEER